MPNRVQDRSNRLIAAWISIAMWTGISLTVVSFYVGSAASAVGQGPVIPNRFVESGQIESDKVVQASATEASAKSERDAAAKRAKTAVDVPTTLTGILTRGGEPRSIEQLRELERQHRRVAAAAARCTVSVEIGPAQGCGVIISPDGFIFTAAHVAMRPGKNATIVLSDGRQVSAKTLGMDRSVDAGLMQINPGQNGGRPWPHASLGSSSDLRPGMWCVATGHPGGYDPDRGPVTRVGRILEVRRGSIITDCALIGGDSGGPLFDLSGRLIAVHSRIGNDVDENLHVPINFYDQSWDRMVRGNAWGYLPGFRPVIGVIGSKSSGTARIEAVKPGSPAEEAGILVDDVIERFGDVPIGSFESLKAAVADTMPGERVIVWLNRQGEQRRIRIEIGRAD